MKNETYDGIQWQIGELIESSKATCYFQFAFKATANCPFCNRKLEGTAHYRSDDSDIDLAIEELDFLDYDECECILDDDEENDEDGDEDYIYILPLKQ